MPNSIKITFLSVATIIALIPGQVKSQNVNYEVLNDIVEQSRATNSSALLVYQDSNLVYEDYFGNDSVPIEAMSASKSVVSLAVGLLLDHGYLDSLDVPVYRMYPEWKQGNKRMVTVRHLVEHASGLQNVANAGVEIEVAPDVVQLALAAELETIPGEVYSYNNKATNLIAGVVHKTSGRPMDEFLDEYLFRDLGVSDYFWVKDKAGNPFGMSGFNVHPADFAKIGQLILNNGIWNGKQLISKQWIEAMLSPGRFDSNYGLQWWLSYEGRNLIIDQVFVDQVKSLGGDVVGEMVTKLIGTYDNGMNGLRAKAMSTLTQEELGLLSRVFSQLPGTAWKFQNTGKIVAYAARGYLGQQLIIVPDKKIVVVRMITSANARNVHGSTDMMMLIDMVKAL